MRISKTTSKFLKLYKFPEIIECDKLKVLNISEFTYKTF